MPKVDGQRNLTTVYLTYVKHMIAQTLTRLKSVIAIPIDKTMYFSMQLNNMAKVKGKWLPPKKIIVSGIQKIIDIILFLNVF